MTRAFLTTCLGGLIVAVAATPALAQTADPTVVSRLKTEYEAREG